LEENSSPNHRWRPDQLPTTPEKNPASTVIIQGSIQDMEATSATSNSAALM